MREAKSALFREKHSESGAVFPQPETRGAACLQLTFLLYFFVLAVLSKLLHEKKIKGLLLISRQHCNISVVSSHQQLFNCQALKKLSMPDNDLSNLPTTIASLVNLKELDISKNGRIPPPSLAC